MKNGKRILKTGTFYILGGFIYAFGLYFLQKTQTLHQAEYPAWH